MGFLKAKINALKCHLFAKLPRNNTMMSDDSISERNFQSLECWLFKLYPRSFNNKNRRFDFSSAYA